MKTPDRFPRQPQPKPCGTTAAYNRGCRCNDCKAAKRDYAWLTYTPDRRSPYGKTSTT